MSTRMGYKRCTDCGKEIQKCGSRKRCKPCQDAYRVKVFSQYASRKPKRPPRVLKCDICGTDFVTTGSRSRTCESDECKRALYNLRHERQYKKSRETKMARAIENGTLDEFLRRSASQTGVIKHRDCQNGRVTIPTRAVSNRIIARHCLQLQGDKFERRVNELLAEI